MKKAISIALISLLATSVSTAMTIKNGKLLSHHDDIPAGAKVTFKDINVTLPTDVLKFKNKQITADESIDINVKANVPFDTVNVGDDVYFSGQSGVYLRNASDSAHVYNITTTICDTTPGVCYSTSDQIQLDVGGELSFYRHPAATFTKDSSDVSFFMINTSIQRDGKGVVFSSGDYAIVHNSAEKN